MDFLKKLNIDHCILIAAKTVYWGLVIASSIKTGSFDALQSALGGAALLVGGAGAVKLKGSKAS